MITIVIVSAAINEEIRQMTLNCIASARLSNPKGQIIIIETADFNAFYPGVQTWYFTDKFNYNACLNLGLQMAIFDYVAFCNNDVYFEKDWVKKIIPPMITGGYLSASPLSRTSKNIHLKGYHEGYEVGKELMGWCIVVHRKLFDIIGKFNETCDFWYSDNVYAEQLKRNNIKHLFVCNSFVDHMGGQTLKHAKNKVELTGGQKLKFEKFRQYGH